MRYRTVICTYLIRLAASDKNQSRYEVIQRKALEFFDEDGKPKPTPKLRVIPTSSTDEEIYG